MREVLTPNTASLLSTNIRSSEPTTEGDSTDSRLEEPVNLRFEVRVAFEVESSDELFVTFGIEHPTQLKQIQCQPIS